MSLAYRSYEEAQERFRWSDRWNLFGGSKERFNIAAECIDRHPPGDVAIRIKREDGASERYTFGELGTHTRRFANHLARRGVRPGDRVAVLLFPSLELYVAMLGTFRAGAVAVMCFPLFGPEAIHFRLEHARVKAVVTTRALAQLVDPALAAALGLQVIDAEGLLDELRAESDRHEWATGADTPCMIQFSSGTTGAPKSMVYRHGAISLAGVVMKLGNGLRADDVYFCPSSPGWGHGIWYGTIAPLIHGKAVGTLSGRFDPERALEALEEWGVTNMAAISSHYRLLMDSGRAGQFVTRLRRVTYTGEAMSKETIEAIHRNWGIYPFVQYGTTEAGPISMDFGGFDEWRVKPGSLGKPMIGGARVALLGEAGEEVPPGAVGQVALWRNGEWLKIGDSAYRDEDGYLWYVARIDDVIISAGYTIGPLEVEEALGKHPVVEECAVIGSPDPERGDVVKAVIVLREGHVGSDALVADIEDFVKTKLSRHEYPRKIEFVAELPKTPDGKIKRKLLRERERESSVRPCSGRSS